MFETNPGLLVRLVNKPKIPEKFAPDFLDFEFISFGEHPYGSRGYAGRFQTLAGLGDSVLEEVLRKPFPERPEDVNSDDDFAEGEREPDEEDKLLAAAAVTKKLETEIAEVRYERKKRARVNKSLFAKSCSSGESFAGVEPWINIAATSTSASSSSNAGGEDHQAAQELREKIRGFRYQRSKRALALLPAQLTTRAHARCVWKLAEGSTTRTWSALGRAGSQHVIVVINRRWSHVVIRIRHL